MLASSDWLTQIKNSPFSLLSELYIKEVWEQSGAEPSAILASSYTALNSLIEVDVTAP